MKILKQLKRIIEAGGKVDLLNIVTFLLLAFYNVIDFIVRGESLVKQWPYVVPFITLSIIIYIFRNKKVTAGIFLFLGFFTIINTLNYSDFSGVAMFVLSYNEIRKKGYGIFLIIFSLVALSLRLVVLNISASNSLIMFFIFVYIFLNFYIRMFKPSININILTDKEIKMLDYMSSGLSQKESGFELNLNQSQANEIIKGARRKTGYDSIHQLMFEYGKL